MLSKEGMEGQVVWVWGMGKENGQVGRWGLWAVQGGKAGGPNRLGIV